MRLNSALLLVLVSFVAWLTGGCTNAPEPRTRLLFATGNGLITSNQTISGGTIVSTSVYAEAGAGKTLQNFKITCTYNNTETFTYLDSTLSSQEFGLFFTFSTRSLPGTETWAFTVTDAENNVYSRQYTLTTTSNNIPRQPFYSYTGYFYESSAVENLRYVSLADGTIYPGYAGRLNPAIRSKVNFYFHQQPDKNVSLQAVPGTDIRFKTSALSPADFSDIRTEEALTSVYASSNAVPAQGLPGLKKNQVIAFNTPVKTGLIRIVSFDKAFDAQLKDSVLVRMRYEIKTQK